VPVNGVLLKELGDEPARASLTTMSGIRYFSHPEIEFRASDLSNFPAPVSDKPTTTIVDLLEVHPHRPIIWKAELDHPQLLAHFRVCWLRLCFLFQYFQPQAVKQEEESGDTNCPQLRILCVKRLKL